MQPKVLQNMRCFSLHLLVCAAALCATVTSAVVIDGRVVTGHGVATNWRIGRASGGGNCYDVCQPRGYSYHWCYLPPNADGEKSWDYCSPGEGLDYRGDVCRDACETRGSSYRWCNLKYFRTWGYCS